jgi:hypothetical protein
LDQIKGDYLKAIKSLLPLHGKQEKRFLRDFELELNSLISGDPTTDVKKLVSEFGSPQEVVAEYLKDADGEELMKHLRFSRRIRIIAILVIAIAIAAASALITQRYMVYYENATTHFIDREVIKVEDGTSGGAL